MAMNAQYLRYKTLADQYRQKGRTEIANALERQAQAELEKEAMDINDVAALQANNAQDYINAKYGNNNGGYLDAKGWHAPEAQAAPAEATVQAPVEQPAEQPVVVEEEKTAYVPTQEPTVPTPAPTDVAVPTDYLGAITDSAVSGGMNDYSNYNPAPGTYAESPQPTTQANELPRWLNGIESLTPEQMKELVNIADVAYNSNGTSTLSTDEEKKKKFLALYPEYYGINKERL